MSSKTRTLNLLDAILCLGLVAGLAYVWMGFLHPDPFYFAGASGGGLRKMLLGLKIGIPLVGAVCILLYILVRTGRAPLAGVALLLGGLAMGAVLCYLPASHFYYVRSVSNRLEAYHPYLQIGPHDLKLREPGQGRAFRIFALGGSTTEWKDSTGRDWASRVEENLRKAVPGVDVQVYNAGREWYTTLHTLINYEVNLRKHKPDLILVMHAINDLLHNADFSYFSAGPFREDYGHFYGPVNRLIKRQSIFQMIGDKLSSGWYHEPRKVLSLDSFQGLDVFKRNIRSLVQLAKLDGAKVVLMTEPNLYKDQMSEEEVAALYMLNKEAIGPREQWDLGTARNGMRRYNAAILEIGASEAVDTLDLEKSVPKDLEHFSDDVHYKDKSHPLVAQAISEMIAGKGLLN